MTTFRTGALCAGLAVTLTLAAPAAAQETPAAAPAPVAPAAPAAPAGETAPSAPKPDVTITVGGEVKLSKQELADAKAVAAAFNDVARGGFPAVRKHVRDLEKVLDHAPADYPKVTVVGDMVIVRSDPGQGMAESLAAGLVTAALQKRSVTIAQTLNIYPAASFLLGAYAVEAKDTAAAIAYLDRGLKLQPKAAMLLSEKGAAYQQARQPEAALAVYDSGLASEGLFDTLSKTDRARLLRGRGYSLGELGRYDEALAAYEESLKEEPGNTLAQGEIGYIRGLKAGKAPTEGQVVATTPPSASPPTPAADATPDAP